MAGRKKIYDDDDGRTIANMNVEGMPWYDRSRRQRRDDPTKQPLERGQLHATIFGVVAAALLIALAFGAVYFAVILLMDIVMN